MLGLAVVALAAPSMSEIVFREGVAMKVAGNKRTPVRIDPIEAKLVLGETIDFSSWSPVKAAEDGKFSGGAFQGGYARFTVTSPSDQVMLLEAAGNSMAYVNGRPVTGDPYSNGSASIPVQLKAGANEFLFVTGRGEFRAKLVPPPSTVSIDLRDPTLPDIVKGAKGELWGAIVLRNATTRDAKTLRIEVGGKGTAAWTVPALSIRKVGFRISPNATGKYVVRVLESGKELSRAELALRVREPGQSYKRTFVSGVDGSVQYFGVNPSQKPGDHQALFLSLHGASVEGMGQADAYSAKSWGHIVAPTNRRPYGFDWEDIGRLDALEVLETAQKDLKTDPTRTYLSGHSMGGHGTWNIGALFPGRFAAIAPSAGWIAFSGYGGGQVWPNDGPIPAALNRANSSSDTLRYKTNYAQEAVYVLHGDADDNVPVTEAREMVKQLQPFHRRLDSFEQPGAGHWWDVSPEPGADCVDWPPIFEMFARAQIALPSQTRHIDFTSPAPGISATDQWVTLEQQFRSFAICRADLYAEPYTRRFVGRTFNLRRMTLRTDALMPGGEVKFDIDGDAISTPWPTSGSVSLERGEKGWAVVGALDPSQKSPARYGGFKDVFRNRVVFVYATKGTPAETEWARSKANYDAQTLWYRGNGSVDVVADTDFDANADRDRNVLLYGNAQTNAAWPALLSGSPLQVSQGKIVANGREVTSDELVSLFIRPRPGSAVASVGVIAPTGMVGARLAVRVPIFQSGAGIPDVLILSPAMLTKGLEGVVATGYFGNDWSIGDDIAWK